MIFFLINTSLILPPEYSWLETYLDNDAFWVEDVLNWDAAFEITASDFTLYSALTTPFFSSSFFFLDSVVKLSFLDLLLFFESDKSEETRSWYHMLLWDITTTFSTRFLPAQFLFYTNNQDYIAILLRYSPELSLVVNDYLNSYWVSVVFEWTPSIVFDLFSDSANSAITEFIEYVIMVGAFFLVVVLLIGVFIAHKPSSTTDTYLNRLHNYLYSTARESRVQFEALLLTFFIFFLYWSMMIAAFDDDREEMIELFDTSFFYLFCFIIIYLFFKYSQHYFAFLEASVAEGRSVSYVSKQFMRDFINSFALLLRFFILLFRLNVYDTLDDFYDSYYIFVADFDDDAYLSELFFSFYAVLFYDIDVNDDRAFSLEDENDLFMDFFYLYFIYWGKFFTFIFFILEEILRLSLAFYICYLIIFDVHAVNASYVEDSFLNNQTKNNNLGYTTSSFKF